MDGVTPRLNSTNLFLFQYPILVLDAFPLSVLGLFPLSPSLETGLPAIHFLFSVETLRELLCTTPASDKQTQKDLFCLLGIWIIHYQTTTEPSLLCNGCDELYLVVGRRIELEDGARGVSKRRMECCEETGETVGW
jgi:hypothetical protein